MDAPSNGMMGNPPNAADAEAAADAAVEDTEGEVAPDQKVVAKFLVSNAAAGSVIGKAGSNIGGATNRRSQGCVAMPHGAGCTAAGGSADICLPSAEWPGSFWVYSAHSGCKGIVILRQASRPASMTAAEVEPGLGGRRRMHA